jgi:hypothetical protein
MYPEFVGLLKNILFIKVNNINNNNNIISSSININNNNRYVGLQIYATRN